MIQEGLKCFCGNALAFEQCCQPLIQGAKPAEHAEALMRSRFSAYTVENYQYILDTYATSERANLSVETLKDSAVDTHWLSLKVIDHQSKNQNAQVEFKAFYQVDKCFYLMHERSEFVLEANEWRYSTGAIQPDSGEIKLQRNDPCICQSGKKFKKCCGA